MMGNAQAAGRAAAIVVCVIAGLACVARTAYQAEQSTALAIRYQYAW